MSQSVSACEHGYSCRTTYFGNGDCQIPCPYCPVFVLQLCFNRLYPNKFFDKNIYTLIFQQLVIITNQEFPFGVLIRCTRCHELRLDSTYGEMFASYLNLNDDFRNDDQCILISGYGSRYDNDRFYFCRPELYKFLGDSYLCEDLDFDRFLMYKEQVLEEYGIRVEDIHWCDECLEYMMECHILFNSDAYQYIFYEDLDEL